MKVRYKNRYLEIIFSNEKRYVLLFLLLRIFAFLYSIVIAIVRFKRSRNQYKSSKVVISIGNITWGGTGKTPLTVELGRYIESKGFKLGIIHHGKSAGDEVILLKESIPGAKVLGCSSKYAALLELERDREIDVIIIDDGYQNWNISRNLNILCLNFKDSFGNKCLIPRGSLRESLSAIKRADVITINKTRDKKDFLHILDIQKYNTHAPLVFTDYGVKKLYDVFSKKELLIQDISGMAATLITAVADPGYVKEVLINIGVDLRGGFIYPDHHIFTKEDLISIANSIRGDIQVIFITEKDYVKIRDNLEFAKDLFNGKLLILFKIGLEYLDNEKTLFGRLDILLDSLSS